MPVSHKCRKTEKNFHENHLFIVLSEMWKCHIRKLGKLKAPKGTGGTSVHQVHKLKSCGSTGKE